MSRGKKTPLTARSRSSRESLPSYVARDNIKRWELLSPAARQMWYQRLTAIDEADSLDLIYLTLGLLARDKPLTYKELLVLWVDISPAYDEYPGLEVDLNKLLSKLESAYLDNPIDKSHWPYRTWGQVSAQGAFAPGKDHVDADKSLAAWHKEQLGLESKLTQMIHEIVPESQKINLIKQIFAQR
jgi:hypothetical protein